MASPVPGVHDHQMLVGLDAPAWRCAIGQLMTPLRIDALGPDFSGDLTVTTLGTATVFELTTTPHVVRRTPDLIDRSGGGLYKVSLQVSGRTEIVQDGRRAVLTAGDLAIYDVSRPYTLRFPESSHTVVMLLPSSRLRIPVTAVSRLTAVTFPAHHPLGRFINPLLLNFGRHADRGLGPYAAQLVSGAVDLFVTMLASEVTTRYEPISGRLSRLLSLKDYIEAHLHDPQLTPSAIAKANYVSTRQLHALFTEQGMSVGTWIRKRRLEIARRDLADPRLAGDSISAIAQRVGLPDATHFSKLFRAEFRESPRSWRARAQSDDSPLRSSSHLAGPVPARSRN